MFPKPAHHFQGRRAALTLVALLAAGPAWAAGQPTTRAAIPARTMAANAAGVRALLNNGNPELAIRTAHSLLAGQRVKNSERRQLLELIAQAEEMRAAYRDYAEADKALNAWKALLKEFPDDPGAADARWHIAWLLWKKGELVDARKAAQAIIEHNPASSRARMARLLMARIAIARDHPNRARKHLLQYLIDAADGSREQALGLAWLAVVDAREHRPKAALAGMDKAIHIAPEVVENDPQLLAAHVQLLHEQGQKARALARAELFLKRYINTPFAPPIRLLHADMLAARGQRKRALVEYDRLAESEAETSIGKQALMRKLMLKYAGVGDFERLRGPLIALTKLANDNQLTDIEAEALLDQARLWKRLIGRHTRAASQALTLYARAAHTRFRPWSQEALDEGASLLRTRLAALTRTGAAPATETSKANARGQGKKTEKKDSQERWLQTIVLWKRYPLLRQRMLTRAGMAPEVVDIQIGVARALRMLMQFDAAERMLARLYQRDPESIQGQRVMLERARLWLDRGDADGVARVMRWLDAHEFTIFRPEMMLIAANMQLNAGKINAASQTLHAVSPDDLARESRADYWRAEARIAEGLKRWHLAARAWQRHAKLTGSGRSAMRAARDLLRAGEYAAAELALKRVPESLRDAEWQYDLAQAEYHTGKWNQAEERLQRLAASEDAGSWRDMARMALADHRATALLERP